MSNMSTLKMVILTTLTFLFLTGCHGFARDENALFFIGIGDDGKVTSISAGGKKLEPISREVHENEEVPELVRRCIEKFGDDSEKCEVRRIPIEELPKELVGHPGSTCHHMNQGAATYERCNFPHSH